MDIPPYREADHALSVRHQHHAGLEIERDELLQNAGHREQFAGFRKVGLAAKHRLTVSVVAQRTGLEHARITDSRNGPMQRLLVIDSHESGRLQSMIAGIALLPQAILRVEQRPEPLFDIVFLLESHQQIARHVLELVGHHVAAAAKLFERRRIVEPAHDPLVADLKRRSILRRIEADRPRTQQMRLLDDHQPQLAATDNSDRLHRTHRSKVPL